MPISCLPLLTLTCFTSCKVIYHCLPLSLHMMIGLQNIGGVLILVVVHVYSNAKTKVCTPLGGARLYFVNHACNILVYSTLCANPCVVIKHQKGGD